MRLFRQLISSRKGAWFAALGLGLGLGLGAGRALPAPDAVPAAGDPAAAPAATPLTPSALAAAFNADPDLESGTEPALTYADLADLKPGLPEDESKAGWQLLLANDFSGARQNFEKLLMAQPGQRSATLGLTLLNQLEGHPEDSTELYLAWIRAAAKSPEAIAAVNAMLQADDLPIDASDRLARLQLELINDPQTDAGVRALFASALLAYPRRYSFMKGADADALMPKSGLVPAYQLTVGPFGLYYNTRSGEEQARLLLQRPFPPENGFGTLEFTDTPPNPAPVFPPRAAAWPRITLRNPNTEYGRLAIQDRLPNYGHTAIFYTVTNLDCPQDSDAIVMLNHVDEAVVFLNGLPIYSPEVAAYPAPNIYMQGDRTLLRVHLQAGSNPMVIKHTADHSNFSVRVLGKDWQPIAGLAVKPLSDDAIKSLKVTPMRGQVASEPVLAYDLAWRVGSADGRQKRRRMGDLIAAAQKSNVATLPEFCEELCWPDYLSAATLAARFRAAWPQSLVARLYEAQLQRDIVRRRLASDGRYGVTARATVDELGKEFPKVYAVRRLQLAIAEERNDPDLVLTLARKLVHDFPDLPLGRVELAGQYLKRGWKPEAEAEISAFLEEYSAGDAYISHAPRSAHNLAKDFFADKGRQSTYLKLRLESQRAGTEGALERAFHLLTLGQPGEGLKLLNDDLARWPVYSEDIAWEIARYQQRLGNWDAFAAALEARLALNPYDTGLANAGIEVAIRRGLTADALAGIDLFAQRFGPSESLSRLALDLKKEDPLAWFKPYDVPLSAVNMKDYTVAKYQSADVAHLVSLRVLKFDADTSYWEYNKSIEAPLITNAVDHVSRQQMGSVKNLLTAESVNPDGKSYIPEYINGGTAEMYNVEVGTAVTTDRLGFHPGNDSRPRVQLVENFGTIEDPIGINKLVVILPPALDAKVKIWMNLPDAVKHTRAEQDGQIVHTFENISHEPLKRENNMPTEDLLPRVELYTEEDMLADEANLIFQTAPAYPSALVTETARMIRKNLPADATDGQIFDAVIQWVKTELKPGQGPETFDDMIVMKVADDRPTRQDLAQALCQALNLPVRDVLQVGSSINPYSDLPALKYRQNYDPNALVQVHGAGMLALEDAAGIVEFRRIFGQQAQLYPSLPAVPDQLGSDSPLFSYIGLASPWGFSLRRYDGVQPVSDRVLLQVAVKVQPDNRAQVLGRAFIFGGFAGQVREQRTDARQRQMLENNLVQWFWPQFENRRLEFIDGTNPDRPMELALEGTVSRVGQVDPGNAQKGISIPALAAQGRNSLSQILGLIGKTEREYDFMLAGHLDSTQSPLAPAVLVYEAPAGWAWSEVPEDLMLQTEFGWYYCDYQVIGNRVTIHRGFRVPKQRLNPEQWKRFNSFLGAIRNYETLGKLVLQPLPATAPYRTPYISRGALRTDFSW